MKDSARTRAVRRAILMAPGSRRELAREADVPHSTLNGIVNRRLGASKDVAESVAGVLEHWAGELADGAREIRRTLEEGGEGEDG